MQLPDAGTWTKTVGELEKEDPYFEVRQDPMTKEVEVVFTNMSMVTYEKKVFTVQNAPGTALPAAGGSGTELFYLSGAILMTMTGTIFFVRRKRRRKAWEK